MSHSDAALCASVGSTDVTSDHSISVPLNESPPERLTLGLRVEEGRLR
jgi:hypothetical protein